MSEFFYIPATVRDPKNHPRRIYFSCHPDDMKYFDVISEQIRAIEADCVIACASFDGDEEMRFKELDDFHLTVVPVTENWFSDGAHMREFVHLAKVHKAILPILIDSSFEERFNKVTNNLQFLRLNDPDYDEKMRRTLQDILFDGKLLDKVRSVFTHRMFVSYCREDAEQAFRLIRAVHSVNRGKRIAIWYDKYLPLGKNFEDSIFNELDNSDFFAVTLTPSLLNRENYVKKYEYPYAQSADKKIVFFELVPVDKAQLHTQMKDSDKYSCASLDDKSFAAFVRHLIKEIPKESTQFSSAETDYLLALAYQNGLFVEFDHDYAAKQFKSAANANHADAAHNLANMFYHGNGIGRDVKNAITWYEKEVYIAEQVYRKQVERFRDLKGVPLIAFDSHTGLVESDEEVLNTMQAAIDQICYLTLDLISRCCNNARVLRDEGRLNGAESLYRIALRSLDLIDGVANQLAMGKKYRSRVENEMNVMLLFANRLSVDDCKTAWLNCLKKYNDDPKSYYNIHGLLHSGHNYGGILLGNECFAEARRVMLQALDAVTATADSTAIGDDRVLCELVTVLYRDVGRTYILEESNSDEQRKTNAKEALCWFESIRSLLDNPPFDLEENPYMYTQKPWSYVFTGDAYDYIDDHSNAFGSYFQALAEMWKVEKVLGDKAEQTDFPLTLLEFYSCCLQKLAQYSGTEYTVMLRNTAELLLTRYSQMHFEAEHILTAEKNLKKLKEAFESLNRKTE